MMRNIIAKDKFNGRVLVLFAAVLGALGGAGCGVERPEVEAPGGTDQSSPAVVPLPLVDLMGGGPRVERPTPGQTRSYAFSLEKGQYLHLVIEQLGVDVVVTVQDPEGRRLLWVDSPNGRRGPEDVFLVAEATGRYLLGIETSEGAEQDARYEIRRVALRAATEEDRKRSEAAAVYWRARHLDVQGAPVEAAAGYREAARLWRQLGNVTGEAWSFYWLGRLYEGDPARSREVVEALTQALDLFQRLRDEHHQAVVLAHLGSVWWEGLGNLEQAARCYEQALDLWRELGDLPEQAARLNDLAIIRVRQGRFQAALGLYSQAIEIWKGLRDWRKLATTRTNLGRVYFGLGEIRLAVDQYRGALALLNQLPNPRERLVAQQRAETLNKLGDALLRTDGPEAALKLLRESLALHQQLHNTRGQGLALNSISLAQLQANRPREALQAFSTALEIFRRQRDRLSESICLNNLGIAYERLGYPQRAREHFEKALRIARESSYSQVEETALYGLARVARLQGRFDEAERWMERTLDILESARSQVWRPDLRSSFHTAKLGRYSFLIGLLAERHRREPEGGHAARAFAASERARARSLLDLLSTAEASPEPEDLRRLDDLSQRLNDRHLALLGASPQSIPANALEREMMGSLEAWRQANAEVQGPPPAVPVTLTLEQVQKRLLDEETLLLEYFLGEERSYLWAATSSTTRFVDTLPGRAEIESAVWHTHRRLTESHLQTGEVAARQAAERLSRMILGPVSDLLARRRLVIVAHGALQVVPFGALPHPGVVKPKAAPLIVDHEIVTLPSISVLATLRSQRAHRKPVVGLLAILADPVLEAGDARFQERRHGARATVAVERRLALPRLPYTAVEAKAIMGLAGPGPSLASTGFEASRQLVRSGRVSGYRILHIATHGLFNDLYPELSALVLSGFDASGRPVDGHLRAYEISQLDLRAELVVLSACRTGLGKDVGGEGLVGLTQGFLHAGAPRLVVSLWNVNDRSTSELMTRFYAALLQKGLPPAQALREAQISLWREDRWRASYHWAGFVFHGDWQ